MNITLSVSNNDLGTSREVLESLSPEELTHKFILFLSAEQKLEEWRKKRYSTDSRSLIEQARIEAQTEKNSAHFDKKEAKKRFLNTCETITKKINHG